MIRRVLTTILLLTAFTFGQVRRTGGGLITTSGGSLNIMNDIGGTVAAFEIIPNGSPASLTVTVQGCMRGGTCDSPGAGTILWTKQVAIPAATGQAVSPFGLCGLAIPGSYGNAMTLEFSAGLANLIEEVSLSTYDVK